MLTDTGTALLKLVGNLPVKFGREDSFKMAERLLLTGRFLLGIRTRDIKEEDVLEICADIGMPEKYLPIFHENFYHANMVFFGFEEHERDRIYKVYLEFWDKVRREIRVTGKSDPVLLHLGFKWCETDNTKSVITQYTTYPMLNVTHILRRMRELYQGCNNPSSYEIVVQLIRLAASRNIGGFFIYMEVSEEGNARKSFDINLYKANLILDDIRPLLLIAAQHYLIPCEEFESLYSSISARLLGHLSGGIDREGRDFLTFYYEVHSLW